jgi:hypothetical protein
MTKTSKVSLRLTGDELARLRDYAQQRSVTVSEAIRELIAKHVPGSSGWSVGQPPGTVRRNGWW